MRIDIATVLARQNWQRTRAEDERGAKVLGPPKGRRFLVEARMPSGDVGYVKAGDEVRVKLEACTFPTLRHSAAFHAWRLVASAESKTGRRSIAAYVLDPILHQRRELARTLKVAENPSMVGAPR